VGGGKVGRVMPAEYVSYVLNVVYLVLASLPCKANMSEVQYIQGTAETLPGTYTIGCAGKRGGRNSSRSKSRDSPLLVGEFEIREVEPKPGT